MKRFLLFVCVAMSACVAMQAQLPEDSVRRYEINVGDFKKLRVSDNLNVIYCVNADSAGMAVFEASQADMQSLIFTNKRQTLVVQEATEHLMDEMPMPWITIYSSSIEEIENKADSTVVARGIETDGKVKFKLTDNGTIIAKGIAANEVEAKIFTGSGTIILHGACSKAYLRCTGTGHIDADELRATDVECMILGTGAVRCFVDGGTLVTKGSGPGRVYYDGSVSEIKSYHLGRLRTIPIDEAVPNDAGGTVDDDDVEQKQELQKI